MVHYRLLIILLMLMQGGMQQFCASTSSSNVKSDTETCDGPVTEGIQLRKRPGFNEAFTVNNCNIAFLVDLGSQFVSKEQYAVIQYFISYVTTSCMSKGIGHNVVAYPMFNKTAVNIMSCCSVNMCEQQIGYMPYDVFVPAYRNTAPIVNESADYSFTEVLVEELKSVGAQCAFNTAILLSNRIFRSNKQDELISDIQLISQNECLTFTQIVVGRGSDITYQQLLDYYGNYSSYQLLVPDLNCMDLIADCVVPCGTRDFKQCVADEGNQLGNCTYPTIPTTLSTTETPRTTSTEDPALLPYWHIIYIIALSNRTTVDDFANVVVYIGDPLEDCEDTQMKVVVRVLAPQQCDSDWMTDMDAVEPYLSTLEYDEIIIASHSPEVYDTATMQLITKALFLDVNENADVPTPRIVLVTDFASQSFIDAYQNNTGGLLLRLDSYDFQIITFSETTAEIFKNHSISAQKVHVDENYSADDPLPVCPTGRPTPDPNDKSTSTTVILIVIIGSCTGFMLLLVIATVVFRQKYIWMERLQALGREAAILRRGERQEEVDDDVIDYWELNWEDVIVRNDRLGHGAYGQVFRGKLRGLAPGVEHYYKPEDRVNYNNCEVAIKMLPVTATDKAKADFLKEIDLMKSIGYNDHIVNMIGCITSHKRVGLILEYCSQGDLAKFLRRRKADLEESRSIDNQVDSTKQFLQFSWQIAHGMEFLQQEGIVHRDLAARNILIDSWGNAKVGDFGLCIRNNERPFASTASDVASIDRPAASASSPSAGSTTAPSLIGTSHRLPIKWLSIECLQKQHFSFKSDIWAYGIVLYEMYTLGETPFDDVEPEELLEHLLNGGRPQRPLLACDKIFEVMQRCWAEAPEQRPTFAELLTILAILIEQSTEGYGYLQLIKASEHYKALSVAADNDRKLRAGSGLSGQSNGAEAKSAETKVVPTWKKLAGALKVRSMFSAAPAASANAAGSATAPTAPASAQDAESGSATASVTGGSDRPATPQQAAPASNAHLSAAERIRLRFKSGSARDLNSTQSTAPALSNSPARMSGRLRPAGMPRHPSDSTARLHSATVRTDVASDDPLILVAPYIDANSPVTICVDGHAPLPVSYPRQRLAPPPATPTSTLSSTPTEDGFLGRYSFNRHSLLRRRQSMPDQSNIRKITGSSAEFIL